ncbi:MAG: hypothetical protein FJX64_07055 [Alphaproteobacteria bacterium]|nr:hypothetical protein [Alphaproteobacteria bacterium]
MNRISPLRRRSADLPPVRPDLRVGTALSAWTDAAKWRRKPSSRSDDGPRERKCLRCQTLFESAWCGERICRRCQSAAAWRQGWGT